MSGHCLSSFWIKVKNEYATLAELALPLALWVELLSQNVGLLRCVSVRCVSVSCAPIQGVGEGASRASPVETHCWVLFLSQWVCQGDSPASQLRPAYVTWRVLGSSSGCNF